MSGSEASTDELANEFVDYCIKPGDLVQWEWEPNVITLEGMQERAARVPGNILQEKILESNVVHYVVGRSEVTLEIVQFLLSLAPGAASKVDHGRGYHGAAHPNGTGSYPLHIACFNAECPVSVIRLLLEANPSVMKQSWTGVGLPLHCYLSRAKKHEAVGDYQPAYNGDGEEVWDWHEECPSFPTGELDREIVKLLVDACPEALVHATEIGTPMHVLCQGFDASLGLAHLLIDEKHECLGMHPTASYYDKNPVPAMHLLRNVYASPFPNDLFQYFLGCNPSCMKIWAKRETSGRRHILSSMGSETPLYLACSNPNITVETVRMIIDACPEMVKEEYEFDGFFPIHALCSNGELGDQPSMEILNLLLEVHPESVNTKVSNVGEPDDISRGEHLPLHLACLHKSYGFCKFLVEKYPSSVSERTWHQSSDSWRRWSSVLPLHLACKYGSLDLVKYLLEMHPDGIHEQTRDKNCNYDEEADQVAEIETSHPWLLQEGNLPLHLASGRKNGTDKVEIIVFLLQKDPNAASTPGKYGNLPLHEACKHPSGPTLDVIRELFRAHPAAIHTSNVFGELPTHAAIHNFGEDDFEGLVFLAKQLPYALGVMARGITCAHSACTSENALKKLELIADIYPEAIRCKSDDLGLLPIHFACKQKSKLEVVQFLARQFPESLDMHIEHVGLPLHCATEQDVFDYLLMERYKGEVERGVPRMHAFLQDEKVSEKDAIIERFTFDDMKVEDSLGRLPLHLAFGVTSTFEVLWDLVRWPEDAICKLDRSGWLPLHHALRHNAPPEIIRYIMERYPGHAWVTDNRGVTPMHIAGQFGCPLTVLVELVRGGGHVELSQLRDNDGLLPLHAACEGDAPLDFILGLAYLTKAGLPLTDEGEEQDPFQLRDLRGCTPLHAACDAGASLEVVESLVNASEGTLLLTDDEGSLPLHKACKRGYGSVVEYLMSKNMGSVLTRNGSNELPIHLLCSRLGKSSEVLESTKYVEAIFKLLLACPETLSQALANN